MITETTLRDKNPGVDYASINLQKENLKEDSISSRDIFISNTTAIDNFSKIENNHNHEERVAEEVCIKNNRITTIIPSCRTGISILMELPLKIMNGVTEMLNFQSNNSPDSEIPAKRPYSPRPHHHGATKQTPIDIARGRGRGRGRSQLRRSGVSQTRHRQERIRQRLSADIQDDIKGLREFEDLEENIEDELPGTPCVDDKGQRIRYGANGAEAETTCSSKYPFFFNYCDTKKRKRKQQRNNKNANDNQGATIPNNCKVRYIPECPIDITNCKKDDNLLVEDIESDNNINRKRLQSDRSVDSEDSCCIIFENGSESDYETDLDYTTTDDEDEDDDNDRGNGLKVRFSQNPKIHTIIAWDYAYRAARRGPWEEMARDRERFKYRINCIARILDPILVPQHRSEIWQHRFAVEM